MVSLFLNKTFFRKFMVNNFVFDQESLDAGVISPHSIYGLDFVIHFPSLTFFKDGEFLALNIL